MEIIQYRMEQDRQYKNRLVEEKRYVYTDTRLRSPEGIAGFVKGEFRMDRLAEEKILVIAFTSSMRPIGVFEVSFGTINVSLVCPRDIFARLLLVNAACFALTHNHPSGDVSPSREDKQITEQIKAASEIMGIPLIDHVIVGEGYYSFRESSGIL